MNKTGFAIIGSSVVLGCTILGMFIFFAFGGKEEAVKDSVPPSSMERYELVPLGDGNNNIILFDKQTGEYWQKFVPPNEGPTEWQKLQSPAAGEE